MNLQLYSIIDAVIFPAFECLLFQNNFTFMYIKCLNIFPMDVIYLFWLQFWNFNFQYLYMQPCSCNNSAWDSLYLTIWHRPSQHGSRVFTADHKGRDAQYKAVIHAHFCRKQTQMRKVQAHVRGSLSRDYLPGVT